MRFIGNIKRCVRGRQVIGLEMECSGDTFAWKGVKLQLRGDAISLCESYTPETISLSGAPFKKMPVILICTGPNVIIKKVSDTDEFTMLSQVMPVSRHGEFFYYTCPAGEGCCWITLIRKSDIEKACEILGPAKCFIVDVLLGEPAVEELVRLIDAKEVVPSGHRLAYASALSFFTKTEESRFYHFFPRYKSDSYGYYRKFRLLFTGIFIVTAGVVVINAGISRSQHQKRTDYETRAGVDRARIERINKMKEKYHEYLTCIAEKGLDRKSDYAFYCSRIALIVPDKMRLIRMEIEPPSKKAKEQEEIRYKEKCLLLSGKAGSPSDVDQLIRELAKEGWVEKINHHDYSAEEQGGVFNIEIQVKISDEL